MTTEKTEKDDSLDVAAAFGEASKAVTIAGKKWFLRELDLNDLIEMQRRLGGIEALDSNDISHLKFLFWLILRKSDDRLTAQQIEDGEYLLTEDQAGRLVRYSDLRDVTLVDRMLKRSGFLPEDEAPGNAVADEETASASPSAG